MASIPDTLASVYVTARAEVASLEAKLNLAREAAVNAQSLGQKATPFWNSHEEIKRSRQDAIGRRNDAASAILDQIAADAAQKG